MVYVNVHGDSIEMGEIPLPFGSAGVPNGAKQSHPRIHPVRPLAHAARQHFARLYCGAAQCYTIQPDGGSQNRIEILDRRKKKTKKKAHILWAMVVRDGFKPDSNFHIRDR